MDDLLRKVDMKDKAMTFAQMRKKHISEWLLIENPETNDLLEIVRGKVLLHSKDRDEVYRKAASLHPKRFATLYTGTITKDAAIVL
jgi:hypothetical protein